MRAAAALLLIAGAPAWIHGCGASRLDPGSLRIEIVTPTTGPSLVTSEAQVPFGGSVGGWSILDPAPVILWENEATGAGGEIGQLLGTWSLYGGVDLAVGTNRLTVRASNGVQAAAQDEIWIERLAE